MRSLIFKKRKGRVELLRQLGGLITKISKYSIRITELQSYLLPQATFLVLYAAPPNFLSSSFHPQVAVPSLVAISPSPPPSSSPLAVAVPAMHVPFLLLPLLVVQLRVVAVVLPAVFLALSFSLSPLVVGLLLPLLVLLPADRAAAALQVPNKQNSSKVSVSSHVTRRGFTAVFPVKLGSASYNYVRDISSRRAFKGDASINPNKK